MSTAETATTDPAPASTPRLATKTKKRPAAKKSKTSPLTSKTASRKPSKNATKKPTTAAKAKPTKRSAAGKRKPSKTGAGRKPKEWIMSVHIPMPLLAKLDKMADNLNKGRKAGDGKGRLAGRSSLAVSAIAKLVK